MAPVTRRSSQLAAQSSSPAGRNAESTPQASKLSSEISFDEPVALRGKRKSTGDATEDGSTASPEDLKTPKRQKLAVRKRNEKAETATPKGQAGTQSAQKKAKHGRSESIADSNEGEQEPQSASKQLEEESDQQLKRASQEVEPEPEPAAAAPKGKHMVFDDDDDVEKYVAAAAESAKTQQPEAAPEEEEDDDDDEAPEAVSTHAAEAATSRAARAAAEAAERQAAETKRKRQERDNLFKQQAEKRKRLREEDGAGPLGAKAAGSGRKRLDKASLPNMLPAEFLTDSSDESEDETALKVIKKPKKITFDTAVQSLSKEGNKPRDAVVGSTVYRVLANQADSKLAPKVQKNSRNLKDDLLKRKRAGTVPAKSKGFFVKR